MIRAHPVCTLRILIAVLALAALVASMAIPAPGSFIVAGPAAILIFLLGCGSIAVDALPLRVVPRFCSILTMPLAVALIVRPIPAALCAALILGLQVVGWAVQRARAWSLAVAQLSKTLFADTEVVRDLVEDRDADLGAQLGRIARHRNERLTKNQDPGRLKRLFVASLRLWYTYIETQEVRLQHILLLCEYGNVLEKRQRPIGQLVESVLDRLLKRVVAHTTSLRHVGTMRSVVMIKTCRPERRRWHEHSSIRRVVAQPVLHGLG